MQGNRDQQHLKGKYPKSGLSFNYNIEETQGPQELANTIGVFFLSSLQFSAVLIYSLSILSSSIKAAGDDKESDGQMQLSLRGPCVSAPSMATLKSWQAVIDLFCSETLSS